MKGSGKSKAEFAGDLRCIHSVFTVALDVAIEHTTSCAQEGYPDPSYQEGLVNYVRCLATLLHSHHTGEDEIAFPYFQEKMPDAPFDRLSDQHREMEPLIDCIDALLEYAAAPPEADRMLGNLNRGLAQMRELWAPHIREEEHHLSPGRIGAIIGMDERVRLGKVLAAHGRKHAGPPSLIAPFILYNLPQGDRAIISQTMPVPWLVTRVLVPLVWKKKWQSMAPFLTELVP